VVMLLGIGSAIIDNVPLVAASMGMFSEMTDHPLWHFIAFSAGNRRQYAYHWLCSWSCGHGNGAY
jgi:hypothetical protein